MDDKEKQERIRKRLEELSKSNKPSGDKRSPFGSFRIFMMILSLVFVFYVLSGNMNSYLQEK